MFYLCFIFIPQTSVDSIGSASELGAMPASDTESEISEVMH